MARDLAAVTHESITDAVTVALRERLERITAENGITRQEFRRDVRELVARATAAQSHGGTEPLEWDEDGLPL